MNDSKIAELLETAIGAHGMYKTRLLQALEKGDLAEFAAARAGRDDLCAFGKWVHQEVPPMLRNNPRYSKIVALHAEFHKSVATSLQLGDRGKTSEAINLVKQATGPLTLELMAWIRESE